MPIHSIDYLNARRAAKHATSGGKVYVRAVNPMDVRARDADQVEMFMDPTNE